MHVTFSDDAKNRNGQWCTQKNVNWSFRNDENVSCKKITHCIFSTSFYLIQVQYAANQLKNNNKNK